MAHHAYVTSGDEASAARSIKDFINDRYDIVPEVIPLSYELFSVEEARKLSDIAHRSSSGSNKVIVATIHRLFHEAQNALLKVLEEPPKGVVIILVVPSTGILLPTLRSRVLPLPTTNVQSKEVLPAVTKDFLTATNDERQKLISKLIDRTKSDNDDTKQAARHEALLLMQGLTIATHRHREGEKNAQKRKELLLFLDDLTAFLPLMHERSAPLKLIYEHLLLVIPTGLANGKV